MAVLDTAGPPTAIHALVFKSPRRNYQRVGRRATDQQAGFDQNGWVIDTGINIGACGVSWL